MVVTDNSATLSIFADTESHFKNESHKKFKPDYVAVALATSLAGSVGPVGGIFVAGASEDFTRKRTENKEAETRSSLVASNITAGGVVNANINLNSQNNLNLVASNVSSNNGNIALSSASGDVNILSGNEYYSYQSESQSYSFKFDIDKDLSLTLGEFKSNDKSNSQVTSKASNVISNQGAISITSNKDTNILASNITAYNAVNINAGNDLNILNSFNQNSSKASNKDGEIILKFETTSNELSAKAGIVYDQDISKSNNSQVVSSLIRSDNSNIITSSAHDTNIVASNLIAKGDITNNSANNLNILSSDQINNFEKTMLAVDAGIRAGIDHNIGSSFKTFENLKTIDVKKTIDGQVGIIEGIVNGEGLDGTLSGNEEGVNGTMRGIEAYQTFNQGPSASAAISVNVVVEGSKSKNSSSNAVGSLLLAGNDINLTTTNKDITIKGSELEAGNNITINSGNNLLITASQNTSTSKDKSFSLEVDVDIYGTKGTGATNIDLALSQSKSSNTTNNNSSLTANNNLTINTANNADIIGANLLAKNDLTLITGNNLNIESLQNTSKSDSFSLGIGVGSGGSGGKSGNINISDSDANRNWVDNQTTLIGQNSVTITTANNTNLTGAVIANKKTDANGNIIDGNNLNITTASLTYQNLYDIDKATSFGIGAGVGNKQPSNAPQSGSFNFNYSAHDIEQITRATIGQGSITINGQIADNGTGSGNQDLISGLNRDITKAQEITKYQVVDEVSGSIIFLSDKEEKKQDYNEDGSPKSAEQRIREWLRPDQVITNSAIELANQVGANQASSLLTSTQNQANVVFDPLENFIGNNTGKIAKTVDDVYQTFFPEGIANPTIRNEVREEIRKAAISGDTKTLEAKIEQLTGEKSIAEDLAAIESLAKERDFGKLLKDVFDGDVKYYNIFTKNYLLPVGIFFDGTDNDATRDKPNGEETNVARIKELQPSQDTAKYITGIGTSGGFDNICLVTGCGMDNKQKEANNKLLEIVNSNEYQKTLFFVVDVTSFSRGATTGADFINNINNETYWNLGILPRSHLMFDPVGSYGGPGNGIDIGRNFSTPTNVIAIQINATKENRNLFDLQSLSTSTGQLMSPNWVEINLPDVHSGIGGGYKDKQQMALYSMGLMIEEAAKFGIEFKDIPQNQKPSANFTDMMNYYREIQSIYNKDKNNEVNKAAEVSLGNFIYQKYGNKSSYEAKDFLTKDWYKIYNYDIGSERGTFYPNDIYLKQNSNNQQLQQQITTQNHQYFEVKNSPKVELQSKVENPPN